MRCGGVFVLAFCLLTALARVSPVAAADHPTAPHGTGENSSGPPEGTDNPFAGSAAYILDLAVWTVVIFVVLILVLGKFAWKPMLAGLQHREENIRSALAEAQAAHEEAKRIQVQLQQQLASAHEQVRQILDEGRRDAEKLRESEMARTAAEIQTERDRLRHEIETQTAQAVWHIWSQAAELATLASAKALGKSITEDGHRRLIDEALAEIRETVAGANGHA